MKPDFDYCDDSDRTNSDDENFSSYGIPPDEEEKPNPSSPEEDFKNSN